MPRSSFLFVLGAASIAGACSADLDDVFSDSPGGGQTNVGGSGGASTGGNPSVGGFNNDGGAGASTSTTQPATSTSTNTGGGPPVLCGNGTIDAGEQCDGANLGDASCADLGFTNPSGAGCTEACQVDYTGCTTTCDGSALEPGELCDGFDLGGMDCTDFDYAEGFGLACQQDCSGFDTSFCNAVCNNGVLEPGETCDGNQVNASCTDFGFSQPTAGEPHCTFFCDVDSSGCKSTCGDGVLEPGEFCDDNNTANGDGCSSQCRPEGTTCAFPIPIDLGFGQQVIAGDTTTGGAGFDTDDARCPAGAAGKSRVYAVTASDAGFMTAWLDRTGTTFDSVLYAQSTCGVDTSTILCADNTGPILINNGGGEVISFPVEQGDTIYLVVDSPSAAAAGAYSLTVDLSAGSTCNDPIPFPVWSGTQMVALGFTNGQTQSGGGTCGGGTQGTGASDVVYRVERKSQTITNMTFSLPTALTNFDSILYGRFDCGNNEIACSDDPVSSMGGEQISMNFNTNNIRYVWVDGFNNAEGNYGLVVVPTP